MKKITALVFAVSVLFGCTDKKNQQKAVTDDVIKIHDKVMGADARLMDNKMKLDTLIKQQAFAGKDTAKMLMAKLAAADSAMSAWMNNFKLDYKGKSDDETTAYMSDQKRQIMAIDSQVTAAVDASNKYLLKIKEK